jgi:hypothetical protein
LENRFAVEFLAHLSLMEWEHIGATEDCPPPGFIKSQLADG